MAAAQSHTTDAQFEAGAGTPGLTEAKDELEAAAEEAAAEAEETTEQTGRLHRMKQMGAKRIGSLAIGIGVVGIVLNQMSNLDVVGNSTGVIDVSSIFQVAGQGLNLLVIGVIIAAAAVLLSLWSGF
jgi:hypothetical protein